MMESLLLSERLPETEMREGMEESTRNAPGERSTEGLVILGFLEAARKASINV